LKITEQKITEQITSSRTFENQLHHIMLATLQLVQPIIITRLVEYQLGFLRKTPNLFIETMRLASFFRVSTGWLSDCGF